MSNKLIPISQHVWEEKYMFPGLDGKSIGADLTVDGTWKRIARALAQAETSPGDYIDMFYNALTEFKFLPAGRIIAGAGTGRTVTLFNCFVMGTINDSLDSIFQNLREAALTMQQGGGIGYDFSTIRPKGARVVHLGSDASGPLSFMRVWNSMCETIMSAGSRRGAMMATLRCDHPDIEAFIDAKKTPGELTNFNLSVLVTDAFMAAVEANHSWPLIFNKKVYREVSARGLWEKIMRSTYDYAEPGVIFIDRINETNNLRYVETIAATNPCGEQPLPPYGACLLGSMNLTQFITDPFTPQAKFNYKHFSACVSTAVRMMDNVIDVSNFPLGVQKQEAQDKRRIGLGVTGLADVFCMMSMTYGDERSIEFTTAIMSELTNSAYLASSKLAKEKGTFPLYSYNEIVNTPMFKRLNSKVQTHIKQHGLRNSHLTSIAPTGTISLLANNVSSGIEPIFALNYQRKIKERDGSFSDHIVEDYAVSLYRQPYGGLLPDYFVTAQTIRPKAHIMIQATIQPWIDSSISKTINVPEDFGYEDFAMIYLDAYKSGLKGCTTYRPNPDSGRGSILSVAPGVPNVPVAPAAQWIEVDKSAQGKVALSDSPPPRASTLSGKTYKLKWPHSDHAMYITINNVEENDGTRPFEIFVNSKNMEHHAWISALTRMVSAIFRRGGNIDFVVEELRQVFDPRGGAYMDGQWVPSLVAQIGNVIAKHIGHKVIPVEYGNQEVESNLIYETKFPLAAKLQPSTFVSNTICPSCYKPGLIKSEGCVKCTHCSYSKC